MATTYQQESALLQDDTLRGRVKQAIQATAINVQGEPTNTANHSARSVWAMYCLKNADQAAVIMFPAVLSDGLTDGTATDAALQVRVANIWNAFSFTS